MMANFTIMRNGLNTEIVGDPHIGQSSEDVTVAVSDDGTYSGYAKRLYYSYCYHNELHRALCDINSNSEYIIPVQAFFEPGMVKLSVELSNGTNRPACNACFLIVTDGAKDVDASVLPSEKTWQEYIQSYIKSDVYALESRIDNANSRIDNANSRIDDAQSGIKTTNSRIDNLIVSSGSESSAEVIDARTGYDGTAYDTLGTAIRTQVNNLNDDIVQLNDGNYFDKYEISNYELGYTNATNGDNNDLEATDTRIRNNRAWWLKKGSIIKAEPGWSFWFAIFDKNLNLTKITAPNFTDKYLVDEDCYIKLSIRKNDNSSLAEYVDSANEYIHVYYPVYNIYQGITLTDGICIVKASDWVNNTDNASDEIENMIAFTASFSNRKIVFDKDVTISRAILLPSNTEVVIDNCTITQADYTFDNVFRGANVILDSTQLAYVPSVIDKIENITIRGEGTANIYGPSINKKDGNADMVGHTYGARTHQIDFCNVNNFKLSGIEFYKTRGWTIELEFVTNFEVSNIVFHTGATQNGDGLDVRGGCAYGKIFNLSGYTGDDMIAFNTHVSLNSPQYNKHPNSTAKYPLEFGYLFNIRECYKNKNASDIHDISIENVSKDGGRYHLVIFLAQYGHKIYNVSMEKLRMNKDYVSAGDNSIISFYNYNEEDFTDGDISNIRMNDVECSATHPYSTDPVAVIYSSLKLKNVWANKVVQKNSGDVVSNLKYTDGVTITNS